MTSYPFTTETGETILNDEWLVRHIREHCGDAVARATAEQLDVSIPAEAREIAASMVHLMNQLSEDMDEISSEFNELTDLIKRLGNL